MAERVKPASELTSEEKVKLMNWFLQADPVLKFETEIVAKCIEDSTFHRFIPVTPSRKKFTSSRKWVVKFYKRIWDEGKFISATPQQINFKHIMETCTIRGRGTKMKQIEIRNSNRPNKRKAWIPNTIDIPDYVDESEVDEGDGDGQEKIAEGGTGEGTLGRSAEGSGGINSGSDQSYEEDGSLATDESDKKNSNNGSGQEETNEEQVGDEDANRAKTDNQNQANITQIPKSKKRGRRSPGESSRSSSGGTAQVEHSGMGEVALKDRMKSPKKKQKTRDVQDAELNNEQEVELDGEQEAGENSEL
ncbi:uncharacterized protein EAF02_006810 [Botrytis sinoallii]|uniref:uncharacterized protein n=1 Tax=Botrytis sinoallii TaxID=1463999 RepID=UPI0019012896|nr:uncharacterized protein EAF02_006810 [Botrytis sinoallii]KAF7880919.1 hypothetical protein EAF02_006810 [Botrytis sinoallii]